MQTIQLQVKDDYVTNILDMLQSLKGVMIDDITLQKDKNLEYDPYFYERKAHLDKTIEAIDNGTMEMYSSDEWDQEMQKIDKELEAI